MKVFILAAGRFDEALKQDIAEGRHPRLDVFELQAALGADFLDYTAVESSSRAEVRGLRRTVGDSAALAWLGWQKRAGYDAVFTTGEDIGIPLAAMMKPLRARPSHTMIAHTLTPRKKRPFFSWLRVQTEIDRILCYSTSEERHMLETLRIPAEKVQRIYYHADDRFFRPDPDRSLEPDLLCSAGQLLRDYDCLIDAVRGLPVRVRIAAGSPWISKELRPKDSLPANVDWRRYDRHELRGLYARAALAIVPIVQNDYQTGIATILEMMSMGKCVIATRTRGQTDTIVDGETGIYVPPADPQALRQTIVRLLAQPAEAARIGNAARRFVEQHASLDRFVAQVSESIRSARAAGPRQPDLPARPATRPSAASQ